MYPINAESGIGSEQSIFEVSTTQKERIGSRGLYHGRSYRYARMSSGTAIGPFKVAAMAAPEPLHVSETGALTGVTTIGSKLVTAVLGAAEAVVNRYAEGFLKIQSAATTGAGQALEIRSHAAIGSGGTGTFVLWDGVQVAITGSTVWSLVANPFADVVINPTTAVAPACGITQINWPAASTAAPQYGWLLTWGFSSVLQDTSALVAGHGVGLSGITAGACAVAVETDIEQRIGVSLEAMGTDDVYASVFVQIAP